MRLIDYMRLSVLCLLCLCLTGCGFNHWMPTWQTTAMSQKADNNMQLGLAYLQAGDNERAKEKLLEAQQQAPRSATINSTIGYFFECIGEWQHAQDYHLKALALAPNSATAHNNYGIFLCHRKQYAEAEKHFLVAAQDTHYVKTASAYENAALCVIQAGKPKQAIHYFNKALSQNQHLDKSWLGLAQLHYQAQEYIQSKQCWDHYQRIVAQPSAEALWLGIQLAEQFNHKEEAQQYAMQLQTQYPDSLQHRQRLRNYPTLVSAQESLYH